MKVFLSWSGSASKQVALALRDWLPNVIQAIEPWMSSEDIEKGARWSADVAKELADTKAGVVCLTPDNRDAPWLNFEAGALSKTVEKEMVCTYLFRLRPTDLTGPLVQFQASEANKDETHKMVATLNRATAKPIPDNKLLDAFDLWWERLDAKLAAIPSATPPKTARRSAEDMLEEILGVVRDQSRTGQDIFSIVQHLQQKEALYPYYGTVMGGGPFGEGAYGGLSNLDYLLQLASPKGVATVPASEGDSSEPDKRERGKLYKRRG